MGKFVKQVLVSLALFLLVFSSIQQVSAAGFKDVSNFKEEIKYLTGLKIINGYPDGTYRPEAPILRVQAVMMIMRDLGMDKENIKNPGFTDIKPGDMGYAEVAFATELGIISGKGNNKFDPNGKMTRAEMSKVLVNAYELGGMYPAGFPDVSPKSWSEPYISALAANNVTNGYPDGTFRPNVTINRGQFAAFLARILNPGFKPYSPAVADTFLEDSLNLQVLDVVKDRKKPILYMIDGLSNRLMSYNYETYELDSVELPYRAERLAYANGKVYVTQHKMAHTYWTDRIPETGAYAVYDARSLKLLNIWHLELDPFDIEATDQGQVFISGGSNQHTLVVGYDSKNGAISSAQSIYMLGLLALTPDQKKLMTISTQISPRDIASYDIVDGKLQPPVDSPYHGDFDMSPDLSISPDGKYLLNGYGHIYSTNTLGYLGSLDRSFISSAVDMKAGELYTSRNLKLIYAYDFPSLQSSYQITTYGDVLTLFYDEESDVLLALTKVRFGKSSYSYLGIEKMYFNVD